MKITLVLLSFAVLNTTGFADPQITSWYTADSGRFAQIYRTDADKASGRTETTWSNGRQIQSQPAYCGVQAIFSSSNWIYIRSTGLGSQVMGPWENGRFPNLPVDRHFIFAFPRHPTVQTSPGYNRLFEIGLFVDGVRMFDACDAFSYSHENGEDASPRAGIGQGDGIWNRDALASEGRTFDAAFAHQENRGTYHYHAEPIALRYELGDHVDFDPVTETYSENRGPAVKHSPILGWMHDGYPIYGPYGFSDPANPASGVRRMVSGFVLRNGRNGADNLALTGRRALPVWEARENHRATALENLGTGPEVGAQYPIGHYIEDYACLGDLGKTVGKDFDLDELNGRWCVTPEYPKGTYAYFTTIDARGQPVYPYNMGRRYHGNPNGRLVMSINEPVATNFLARPAAVKLTTALPAKTQALIWNPGTGGYETK